MHGFVLFMLGGLADGADKSFGLAGRIDANEVEDLSLVQVTFGTFQVANSNLFELFWIDVHQLQKIWIMFTDHLRSSHSKKNFKIIATRLIQTLNSYSGIFASKSSYQLKLFQYQIIQMSNFQYEQKSKRLGYYMNYLLLKIFLNGHTKTLQWSFPHKTNLSIVSCPYITLFKFLKYSNFKMIEPPIDRLYEQNQRLGYRVNYLTDENNYYRITINNIKKLNTNINKHLLTANNKLVNSKNSQNVVDPRTVGESYITITNKIHLKNLQMKVGNMKRKVDKVQKMHSGSITSLQKQSEMLEKEVNILAREYEFQKIRSQLMDNLYLDDYLVSKINSEEAAVKKHSSCKFLPGENDSIGRGRVKEESGKVEELQEQNIKLGNKLEQILKQEKEIRQQKVSLLDKIKKFRDERQKLANQVYKGFNLRTVQASEMQTFRSLADRQHELIQQIGKQDVLLQEQYKTNQEYKQKILDRNQLEVKDIKGLQEKIKKRREEVKDIRIKCEQLQQGKSKRFIPSK